MTDPFGIHREIEENGMPIALTAIDGVRNEVKGFEKEDWGFALEKDFNT